MGGLPVVLSENAVLRSIPSRSGEIELRCFIPPKIDGAYLYICGEVALRGFDDPVSLYGLRWE